MDPVSETLNSTPSNSPVGRGSAAAASRPYPPEYPTARTSNYGLRLAHPSRISGLVGYQVAQGAIDQVTYRTYECRSDALRSPPRHPHLEFSKVIYIKLSNRDQKVAPVSQLTHL